MIGRSDCYLAKKKFQERAIKAKRIEGNTEATKEAAVALAGRARVCIDCFYIFIGCRSSIEDWK